MLQSVSTTTEVVSDYVYDSGWSTVEKTSGQTYMLSSVTPTYSATDANVILVDYISSRPTMYNSYLNFSMSYPTGSTSSLQLVKNRAYANYNSFDLRDNTVHPYEYYAAVSGQIYSGVIHRLVDDPSTHNTFILPNGERAHIISPVPTSATGSRQIDFYVSSSAPNNTYHSGRVRILTLDKARELFKEI